METGGQKMPDEWIDKDTHHKIVKLTRIGGSSYSFYFHNNPFIGNKMVFYNTSPQKPEEQAAKIEIYNTSAKGKQIYWVDLKTLKTEQLSNHATAMNGEIVSAKTKEIFYKKGLWALFTNREFLSLLTNEIAGSLSKRVMIQRVKQFLPVLDPKKFNTRGTAGIRSLLVNEKGNFIPDTLLLKNSLSLHILNYNSPGATGALPLSAMIVQELANEHVINKVTKNNQLWNIEDIYSKIKL